MAMIHNLKQFLLSRLYSNEGSLNLHVLCYVIVSLLLSERVKNKRGR
jgi:hypothetical protein